MINVHDAICDKHTLYDYAFGESKQEHQLAMAITYSWPTKNKTQIFDL